MKHFRLTPPPISENDVEAGCMTILELHHYAVYRLHAGLFESLDGKRKIYGARKGTPDWICIHEQHRGFLMEVKRPGAKLSPDQESEIAMIRLRFSVPVVVVESAEGLCNFLARHERSP